MDVGINVRLLGIDGEDLGFTRAPAPVEPGDVVGLADGSMWRVLNLIDLATLDGGRLSAVDNISRVDVLCWVEPA